MNSIDTILASERIVAGCCLLGPEHTDTAAALLTTDDFGHSATQLVFATAAALSDAGKPVAADTVFAELLRTGKGEDVGGPTFLADLLGEAGVGAGLEYHAGRVRDSALTRRLNYLANEMAGATRLPGQPAVELLAIFEQKLFDLGKEHGQRNGGPVDADQCIADAIMRIDERQTGQKRPGVLTGFADLDNLLGGLRPGTLTVVAARPGCGKTAMAAAFALSAATAGTSSLFVSLEMDRAELADRFLAMTSGVSLSRITGTDRLNATEAGKVGNVRVGTHGGRIWIDDRPGQTVARISSTSRRAVRRHNVGLVIVDYLSLVHPENAKDPRHLQVGMIATRLKELARTARVPVVALSQMSRDVEKRADEKPRLSDLRESGQIEADADAVVFLHPHGSEEPDAPARDVDAVLEKNRHGPRGVVPLVFRGTALRFEPRSVEWR